MERFEDRMVITALSAAVGFFAVAANVGPLAGLGAAVILFFSALMGPVALSGAAAGTVALMLTAKLKRLQTGIREVRSQPDTRRP